MTPTPIITENSVSLLASVAVAILEINLGFAVIGGDWNVFGQRSLAQASSLVAFLIAGALTDWLNRRKAAAP